MTWVQFDWQVLWDEAGVSAMCGAELNSLVVREKNDP